MWKRGEDQIIANRLRPKNVHLPMVAPRKRIGQLRT